MNWFSNKIAKQNTADLWYHGIPEKVFSTFANGFHNYEMQEMQKCKKLKTPNCFLSYQIDSTAKPAHPAAFFAMFWSAIKKQS